MTDMVATQVTYDGKPLDVQHLEGIRRDVSNWGAESDQSAVPLVTALLDALAIRKTEVEGLRVALADALEGMEDMIAYVTPYFIEKWGHEEYIRRVQAALGSNTVSATQGTSDELD